MAARYGVRVWLALATVYVVWGSTFIALAINPIVAVALGWLILGEDVTTQMVVAGGAVLVSVAVIVRSGGTSLEPGRGLFARQRPIAAAAATEPTA